jgi:hypothetical protein
MTTFGVRLTLPSRLLMNGLCLKATSGRPQAAQSPAVLGKINRGEAAAFLPAACFLLKDTRHGKKL